MIRYFVTGTDTGVGKTTFGLALLRAAAARGLSTAAMKPAETGCEDRPEGDRYPQDASSLLITSTLRVDLDVVCPFRLREPLAPAVAARLEGTEIALDEIERSFRYLVKMAPDLLVVEGAGGLLVPLTETMTMADLAAALALPLIIVARDSLGTINHTLLTASRARSSGLEIAGVVLCESVRGTSEMTARRNAEEIARWGDVEVLGWLRHGAPLDDAVADRLLRA